MILSLPNPSIYLTKTQDQASTLGGFETPSNSWPENASFRNLKNALDRALDTSQRFDPRELGLAIAKLRYEFMRRKSYHPQPHENGQRALKLVSELVPEGPLRESLARFWFFFESPWSFHTEPDVIIMDPRYQEVDAYGELEPVDHPGSFMVRWTPVEWTNDEFAQLSERDGGWETMTHQPSTVEREFFIAVWSISGARAWNTSLSLNTAVSLVRDTCGSTVAEYLAWQIVYGFDVPTSPGIDLDVPFADLPLDAFIDDFRSWHSRNTPDPYPTVINRKSP